MKVRFVIIFVSMVMGVKPLFAQDVMMHGGPRVDYYTDILSLALSYHPNKNYQLKFYNYDMPKERVFDNIAAKEGIDVIAAGATYRRSEKMLGVPIPLVKGLYGWRVPLLAKEKSGIFDTIHTLAEFKSKVPGQLLHWSDAKILKANNIKVATGVNFLGLFGMLAKQRFDCFPRSVLEVESEYQEHKDLGIIIAPDVMLHYPTAYIFYVNNDSISLAKDIQEGLNRAIADGKMDKLFSQYFGDAVEKIRQQNRRTFLLDNPMLPSFIPLDDAKYWLNMSNRIIRE